jgi:acyl carrier protein
VHIIDLPPLIAQFPRLARQMSDRIWSLLRTGVLKPLPYRSFPANQVVPAFRYMSQARHSGKVVLSMEAGPVTPTAAVPEQGLSFRTDATYLITGGLSGLGLATATWMVEHGARHLLLASRTGLPSPEARAHLDTLRNRGVQIRVAAADVSRQAGLARALQRAGAGLPPIRGIIHSAMVLDDATVANMTPEKFQRVLAPKVAGAWNLHALSRRMPLDFFVLYSSISSVIGSPGQANYAAANQFLDGLARYRRARGLPALSVNWGRIGEVGVVARDRNLEEYMGRIGVHGLPPATALETLGRLLQGNAAQVSVVKVDWRKISNNFPAAAARYAELVGLAASETETVEEDWSARLRSVPAAERVAMITELLKETIAKVMRTSASKLDPARPLNEQGMDSLMAVELLVSLQNQFKVSLPPAKLSAGTSITKIATMLDETLGRA